MVTVCQSHWTSFYCTTTQWHWNCFKNEGKLNLTRTESAGSKQVNSKWPGDVDVAPESATCYCLQAGAWMSASTSEPFPRPQIILFRLEIRNSSISHFKERLGNCSRNLLGCCWWLRKDWDMPSAGLVDLQNSPHSTSTNTLGENLIF